MERLINALEFHPGSQEDANEFILKLFGQITIDLNPKVRRFPEVKFEKFQKDPNEMFDKYFKYQRSRENTMI